jgi:hypothetical protein
MRIPAFCLCASGLLVIVALAQQPPPDPAIVMRSLDKQMEPLATLWLHSPEPRLQAWGAYLVLRDRHTEAIPALLEMVARHPAVEALATQADVDQHYAMLGVLDALIQFGAQVPSRASTRSFPYSRLFCCRAPRRTHLPRC